MVLQHTLSRSSMSYAQEVRFFTGAAFYTSIDEWMMILPGWRAACARLPAFLFFTSHHNGRYHVEIISRSTIGVARLRAAIREVRFDARSDIQRCDAKGAATYTGSGLSRDCISQHLHVLTSAYRRKRVRGAQQRSRCSPRSRLAIPGLGRAHDCCATEARMPFHLPAPLLPCWPHWRDISGMNHRLLQRAHCCLLIVASDRRLNAQVHAPPPLPLRCCHGAHRRAVGSAGRRCLHVWCFVVGRWKVADTVTTRSFVCCLAPARRLSDIGLVSSAVPHRDLNAEPITWSAIMSFASLRRRRCRRCLISARAFELKRATPDAR